MYFYNFSLEGCKSAWGNVDDMYNHLITKRMTHNRNYLKKFHGIGNLTKDIIFNKSRELFDREREIDECNGIIEVKLKQIIGHEEYFKIKNRPRDWTEKGAKRLKEVPESDLTHYNVPSESEKASKCFATFEILQIQLQTVLEEIQKAGTASGKLKNLFNLSINQCEIMLQIFKRNTDLIIASRLEQIIECHNGLKVQYQASEQQISINQANNEIAKHFSAYEDEKKDKKARSTKPLASDLDEKYCSEITHALEVSTSSDADLLVIYF
jgi:hypothetical protein